MHSWKKANFQLNVPHESIQLYDTELYDRIYKTKKVSWNILI